MNLDAIFQVSAHLQPRTFHGLSLHSEAIVPIIREKKSCFSVMTPFNLETGVKGQIQHLEKIPRP